MSEYWLISAPGDKTCQQTFDAMNNLTSKQNNLCNNYKFHIPDLKVGTLDQLVGLSDDLGKLDTYVEQITRKVAAYLGEVLEDQRDKLHENLLANNSPGPPDECTINTHNNTTTTTISTHSELTGKSSNLSNSRDTTTTSCSACPSGSCLNFSSNEESERDYDLLTSSMSPVCNCDCECATQTANATTSPTLNTLNAACSPTPSLSAASACNAAVDVEQQHFSFSSSIANLRLHTSSSSYNHHQRPSQFLHQQNHFSSLLNNAAAAACSSSTSCFISSAISSANVCATGPATANSSYLCSTSAPTSASANNSLAARRQSISKLLNTTHNNNTCSINNNSTSTTTTSLCGFKNNSLLTSPPSATQHQQHQQQQQQHSFSSSSRGFVGLFCNSRSASKNDVNESPSSPHHNLPQRLHQHNTTTNQQHHHHHHQQHHQQQPHHYYDDNNQHKPLKSSDSLSDVSDTFEWWFQKHKRNSTKKSRSSPVSSCCGSSSHGRSSPDNDMGEPPTLPLSPADLSVYITRFQWDMAKYPIKQSLRNIADIISKQIGQIDADLKTKSNAYNNLKGSLQNLEKKQTGSLLTRNLADLVKKEHFILDSEYLTTLLVIVPKMLANEWMANYEKITDMIVPRSSTLITQDNDYCLYNVTLFKKVVEEFKLHAREKKFIVRDFVYNEEELAAGQNERTKLITDKKKQFGPLVRWLKVNFSEAFCALIHVKALRVFVESVLRYGLPVNFQAILIEPNKKSMKRLRDCLNQLYGHLDGASAAGQAGNAADTVDIPGLGFGQSEYYPYVFYKLNIDMIETAKM
ncbi:V-type proton ATPase subunit C [Lucilia cuprina]|uniref:V-type proton ATPase subunit C n=2 Tax=Lucilia cuprina TaxID=7375 RepID=A0A0L0C4I2_LUCCU|nr:V-type proton ATPase subunit C [Lucilia cuprina]KNC27195.1 V-type proton ATPase subunit C [Lucilia cuprina]